MINKFLSFLGLARKAGKLSLGADPTIESIKGRKAKLILLCEDLSVKSNQNIISLSCKYKIETKNIPICMDQIKQSIGKRVGIIAINDSGFANKIKILLDSVDRRTSIYDDEI